MFGKDLGNGLAGGNLDLGVGVGERQVQLGCEPPADRRLARAHEPDQHDASAAPRASRIAGALGLQVLLMLSQSSPSFVEAAVRSATPGAMRGGPHGSMIFSC